MKQLWVEQYRPKDIDGYVFRDEAQRDQVKQWINMNFTKKLTNDLDDDDEETITILPVSSIDFHPLLVIKEEDNGIHYENVKNPDIYQWNLTEINQNIGLI